MTTKEYIIENYKEAKKLYGNNNNWEDREEEYKKIKQENYIEVSRELGILLFYYTTNDIEAIEEIFKKIILLLIQNCLIENKKPITELNEGGYGYNNFEYRQNEQRIMQFFEGYLACQIVTKDIIWFIELGELLGIIKLDK